MLDLKKEQCTGCGACINACPIECIIMIEDKEGFLYPNIDMKKCTDCGICEESCPAINIPIYSNFEEPIVYAAWSLDDIVRADSSSGGIFTELSNMVLDDGGFVSGARYNSFNLVEHCVINSREKLHELRQSKYVQSEIGLIFKDIKKLLEESKTVMFTGTPCHIAGLSKYLNKKYDNLLLCDIVCHGVNSPMVYSKYFANLEKKYESKIKKINFRDKRNGWTGFGTSVIFENGKEYYSSHKEDLFFKGFLSDLYLRTSCYSCQFKGFPRLSDITLADFWGVDLSNKREAFCGVSLVLINSEKGKYYTGKISSKISKIKKTLNEAVLKNPCMVKSVPMSSKRGLLFKALAKESNVRNVIREIINYE